MPQRLSSSDTLYKEPDELMNLDRLICTAMGSELWQQLLHKTLLGKNAEHFLISQRLRYVVLWSSTKGFSHLLYGIFGGFNGCPGTGSTQATDLATLLNYG